jgi:hypothetical protein
VTAKQVNAKTLSTAAGKGGLAGRVGSLSQNAFQQTDAAVCQKIEKQFKNFEMQTRTAPKDRKKILSMRL